MATRTPTEALATMKSKMEGGLRNLDDGVVPVLGSGIIFGFGDSIAVATTDIDSNTDILRLCKFPAGAYIWDFRGDPSDLDGATALVYDIVTTDDSDVVKDTLVSASTAGQAGTAFDRLTAAQVGGFVGDRWLAIKVTTASGTPVAGTYKFVVSISIGLLTYAGGVKPYMLDAAV